MRQGADELVRALAADGTLSVRAIVATDVVSEAAARHDTAPTASAALGRVLMGALLMAVDTKTAETTQIQIRGDGPLGFVTAVADGDCRVRGYVERPETHLPPRRGKLDVGGAVGDGILTVVRYHPSWREPYSGIVPLTCGEIAEDLAHYLNHSEQKPSAIGLGVFVASDGAVDAAGGYLVQALPGASDAALAEVTETIRALPSPTEMVRAGMRPDDILERLCAGLGAGERQSVSPAFHCHCDRSRVERAVLAMGREEIARTFEEREDIEVVCEFCASKYALGPDDVRALLPDG